MNKRHIILVGMPGCGKSTVGGRLSQILNIPFVDTDNYIVNQTEQSIMEIFENHGENYFRTVERQVLETIFEQEKSVISTGGGMPCFFDNMEVMNANAITVYLRVSAKNLFNYLKTDTKRPLVQGKTPEELMTYINSLLENRKPFYEQADIIIEAHNNNPDKIAETLAKLITN